MKLFRPKSFRPASFSALSVLWALSCAGPHAPPAAPPTTDAPSPEAFHYPSQAPTLQSVAFQQAAPMSLTTSDGTGLRLTRLSAKTVVDDPLAYTELTLSFENPEDRVLEGRFRIALPEGASVSRFAMRIGDKWQEGEVLRKQRARQTYEDFLHRRQDPALLEQGAGNEFAARVFPIGARQHKQLIISFAQTLGEGDPALVPLRGLPKLDELELITTRIGESTAGSRILKANHVPIADVRLDPTLRSKGDGLRSGDVALLRLRPWASASPDPLESTLLLIDSSASQALGFEQEVALASHLVESIAGTAGADTPVSIATFDQTTELVFEGAAGSFGAADKTRILSRHALGASDLEGALTWAQRYLQRSPRKRLVVFGDGVATAGDDEGAGIAAAAAQLSDAGIERIDAVALGGVRDSAMLSHLVTAELPRHGVVIRGDAATSLLTRRLTRATRSNVKVELEGASWWWPKTVDGLQPGDEITVLATIDGHATPGVTVDGKRLPTPKLKAGEPHLVRQAWARARIDSLLDEERELGRSPALAEQIAALSVEHRVLSPHTSLLVLETQADYERYGIDRTSLASILAVEQGRLTTVARQPPLVASSKPSVDPDDVVLSTSPRDPLSDPLDAKGNMWGDEIGESFGAGGLGLSGVGEGGGGRGESIELGTVGTIGHGAGVGTGSGFGSGSGRAAGSAHVNGASARPPRVRMGSATVSGRIPPEIFQRIVRQNFGRFRACYAAGLLRNPDLQGRVVVRFVVDTSGKVTQASANQAELSDQVMVDCVVRAFRALTFPAPEGGIVTVIYPLVFAPTDMSNGGTRPNAVPPPPADPKPKATPYSGDFGSVMSKLAEDSPDDALRLASQWRAREPANVLALVALGESLEAAGDLHFAARAYGSIVDMYPDRADLRRFAGERMDRIGTAEALASARDTYGKALRDRPDHPSSHRLLAYAELRLGHADKAFAVLENALQPQYRVGNFEALERIFHEDLGLVAAMWIRQSPDRRDEILAHLKRAGASLETEPSMRIVMTWETDANDVDLHIFDTRGGHAYYSDRRLDSGGELYADITSGYGPECFTVRKSQTQKRERYDLFAHYYRRGPMGYGMGKVAIVHHDGKGTLAFDDRPYVVMSDDAYVALGEIEPKFL